MFCSQYYYFLLKQAALFIVLLSVVQGGLKITPLPNSRKIILKLVSEIRFSLVVKLKYESSAIIFFVGIIYSMRDLLYDLSNYA